MNNEELIKARDAFRDIANALDEIIELCNRSENGEDVEKELESAFGRYMFKLIELDALNKK